MISMKVEKCPKCGWDYIVWVERQKGKHYDDEMIKYRCLNCCNNFTYIRIENENKYEEVLHEGWDYNIRD